MTREEASKVIKDGLEDMSLDYIDNEQYEALTMAIKALEQESSGDLISRQAVLDINESHHGQMPNHINHQIWQEIKDLPSVKQEPKTGHWINRHIIANKTFDMIVCSECGEEFSFDAETGISEYNYCPNCGAKMVEPQERSDKE